LQIRYGEGERDTKKLARIYKNTELLLGGEVLNNRGHYRKELVGKTSWISVELRAAECKDKELCFITRNLGCQVQVAGFRTNKEKQIFCNMEYSSLLTQDANSLRVKTSWTNSMVVHGFLSQRHKYCFWLRKLKIGSD